jgi:hypothetical protein
MRTLEFPKKSNPSRSTVVSVSTYPLTEFSTRNFLGVQKRPARRDAILTAICETIVWKMWDLPRLKTLWAPTAWYKDSFAFTVGNILEIYKIYVFTSVAMKNVVFGDIITQFVPHRRHITSPLQSPAC